MNRPKIKPSRRMCRPLRMPPVDTCRLSGCPAPASPSIPVGKSLTVGETMSLIHGERRARARLDLYLEGRLPWWVELDRYGLIQTLKCRADRDTLTGFVLEHDGSLTLRPSLT